MRGFTRLPFVCALALACVGAPAAFAGAPDPRETLYQLPLPEAPPPVTEQTFLREMLGRLALSRGRYLETIARLSEEHGVPSSLVDAVVRIESAYDPGAYGGVGEIGLMQVRPTTAAMLGFRGSITDLAEPETNLKYGVTYLAKAWRLAGGDLCRTLMKYRAGHGEERMSALSVTYCMRAREHLASLSALAQLEGAAASLFAAPVRRSGAPGEAEPAMRIRVSVVSRGPRRALHPIALSQGGFRLVAGAGAPAGFLTRPAKRRLARL